MQSGQKQFSNFFDDLAAGHSIVTFVWRSPISNFLFLTLGRRLNVCG